MDITYTFMIPLLEAIHSVVHSYGWAIILLTVLIRLLVWPLVASSTKSMQRMSQLQPALKKLQEKYKDNPEVFQKKTMEFYSKNKLNPLGGCLPTLVQLPILIALFATFTGPPFQDKPIPVKVTLAKPDAKDVKIVQNPTSGATSPYLSPQGKLAKFAVQPGDQTLIWGRDASGKQTNEPTTMDFHINTVEGTAPADFQPKWKIASDTNGATIDVLDGKANFPAEGDVTIEAQFPNSPPIDVPVHVGPKQPGSDGGLLGMGGSRDPFITKEAQSEPSTVNVNGQPVKIAIVPGKPTVSAGSKGVQFEVKALEGTLADVKPIWHIVKDPNAATVDEHGHAMFPRPSDVVVEAVVPGEAKNEPFLFVSSIGKVAKGAELLQPRNWDVLGMLIVFAITMFMSQKLMVQPNTNMDPDQAAIQKQTQQTMPLAVTAMFFFFALPAGVYLYLVVSNVLQTLQTWLIYKSPSTGLILDDDDDLGSASGGTVIDVQPAGNGTDGGQKISTDSKKKKKNKQ